MILSSIGVRLHTDLVQDDLEPNTIYELIQSHGRTDMYLFYATLICHLERVVEHWILEEDWVKAIDAINRQSNLELYYQFGPVLMRNAPRETVDSWIRQPALDPLRLVPALLQFQLAPRDPLSPNQATRYLNHVIFEQQNTSSTLHNLVIALHYSQRGFWEGSVDLALEKGDLELAKLNADKPEDDPHLRKKLWLKIAKFVVQDKKDIKM